MLNHFMFAKAKPHNPVTISKRWLKGALFGTALLCLQIPTHADKTFAWSGDDSRFTGWFSVSEADYTFRSFTAITAANFQFTDPQNSSANVALSDPRGFYANNMFGTLSSDGTRLVSPAKVAVWRPEDGIEVTLIAFADPNGSTGFRYFNFLKNIQIESPGVWTLVVPEPTTITLALTGIAILCCSRTRSPRRNI